MKKVLLILGVACLSLAAGPGGSRAATAPISSVDPAIPLPPDPICPDCGYTVASKKFEGELSTRYTAHRYPLTRLTLTLYDISGNVADGPITLAPTSAYGGQDMSQNVTTTVSSGVLRATISYHTDDGYDGSESVIVQ